MNIDSIIQSRYSARKFSDTLVPKDIINQILETSLLAPSAVNYQPYRVIVITDKTLLEQIYESYPREWFRKAPQVMLICGNHEESWKRAIDNKNHCDIDVAILVDHITLKATSMGLGTCWVCNFNPQTIVDVFNLPSHIEPLVLLPFGYPDTEDSYSTKEKKRKGLNDIVTFNSF